MWGIVPSGEQQLTVASGSATLSMSFRRDRVLQRFGHEETYRRHLPRRTPFFVSSMRSVVGPRSESNTTSVRLVVAPMLQLSHRI